MSLFHSREDRIRDQVSEIRFTIARALSYLGTVLKIAHGAIVTAKMHRLRSELMFRPGRREGDCAHEGHGAESDAAKFPQRPLILDDKWDF
jgi:hypothetical protein